VSNATLNATGSAKLFATEEKSPSFTARSASTNRPAGRDLDGSAKSTNEVRQIAELRREYGFGPKLRLVANSVERSVAFNLAKITASRI
jgi:hypothetical protein